MTASMDASSARRLAKVGGILYLVIILVGALGEAVVRGGIVVPGDATATAANLRTMEWLWRLGVAGEVVLLACATALAPILYILLRPAGAQLALMAVCFNLMCIAIEGVGAIFLAQALFPLADSAYLAAVGPEQRQALSMLAIRSHSTGFGIALVFFGVECVLLGLLIARSGYMPRLIGWLMQLAGACYVINSLALLLSPPLSSRLFPAILLPALVAELSLALWLLIKGVRPEPWESSRAAPR